MPASPVRGDLATAAVLCLAAGGLLCAPSTITGPLRMTVRDALHPGQQAVRWASREFDDILHRFVDDSCREAELTALQSELAAWKLRARTLEIEAAALHERLERDGLSPAAPIPAAGGEPLVVADLVQAAVLGEEHAALWRSGRLIDKGRLAGVAESALVLEDARPLIDQGEGSGLEPGHPVYAGRCVVGRVAAVGRWSSTVQSVTDPGYRGFAQLVRQTSNGPRFGAQGVLEGQGGPLCRLKYVSATEPVGEGDEVYTADRDGLLPLPMYYGKVVRAELAPGASHWEIWIKPAVEDAPRTVQVLRRQPNPARFARQPGERGASAPW